MKKRAFKSKNLLAIFFGICFICVTPVYAAEATVEGEKPVDLQSLSKEELRVYWDVDAVAEKYGADSSDLLDKVYNDLHSEGKFSPFSNIELAVSGNNEENAEITRNAGIPNPVMNQDSTMYLETGNNCASGNYPYIGCVAVHKTSSTNSAPIFPFGTYIRYQGTSVTIGGKSYNAFTVEDIGDTKFTRSIYWTDVYGGANTQSNQQMA